MAGLKPKGDSLSVNDIMRHIRKEIRKKQEEGIYPEDKRLPDSAAMAEEARRRMDELMGILNAEWNPERYTKITSHRPYTGKFIVLSKKLIRFFTKPLSRVMLQGQKEFNQHLVQLINYLIPFFKDLSARYEDLGIKYLEMIKGHNRLHEGHLKILESFNIQQRKLEEIISGIKRVQEAGLKTDDSRLQTQEITLDDKSYLLFEDRFRGSRDELKERQRIYIDHFKGSEKVLDIGCGRGEFLEILKEEGIDSYGIDTNEPMVSLCKDRGLNVIKGDGVDHLRSLEDNSLGGIFAAQVVEHLEGGDLIEMIRLSYQKLRTGATFIAETINPLCLTIFSGPFYLDLTHIRPIHPQALLFLMEMTGFRDVEIKFTSPYPEEMKLQQVDFFHSLRRFEDAFLNIVNNNINRLNELLYGYQEYAVIGKK